jgi:hypothetical protein
MLSIVLSLAIASISAQSTQITGTSSMPAQITDAPSNNSNITTPPTTIPSSISPECQALLQKSSPALDTCGAGFVGITSALNNGSALNLPSSTELGNGLDSFCSKQCADALDVLVKDISSPACSSLIEGANTSGLPSQDIPAVVKVLREALCLKDGSQYCASTLTSLLSTNPSSNAQSLLQNQTVVCSKCLKLEADVITRGLTTVSTTLQQSIQPQLQALTDEQKKCPSSSAMGISVGSVVFLALGMVML